MNNRLVVLIAFSMLASAAWGQQPQKGAQPEQQSMPGMDMSGMKGMPAATDKDADNGNDNDSDASAHAMLAGGFKLSVVLIMTDGFI